MTVFAADRLTLPELTRMLTQAIKDKSYQLQRGRGRLDDYRKAQGS